MADKSHSVSTAGPSDREDLGGTSVSVSARRTTVVAVLVVGATVFAVAIAAVLSGAGASSPERESSVINEGSSSHRVFFENQRGQTLWVHHIWVGNTMAGGPLDSDECKFTTGYQRSVMYRTGRCSGYL